MSQKLTAASQSAIVRLPSLTALRSFEAAARLGSMTKAADELCVTHGAISRQVQALEADVGFKLLNRLARSLEPTDEGRVFAVKLSHAFGIIGDAVSSLKPGPVVLSCSASMTVRWLIPRLPLFKAAYPHITLQLAANHGPIDFLRESVDVAIRNDIVRPPTNYRVEQIGVEYFGPVCSPELLRRHAFADPAAIWRANRLSTMTRPSAWPDWCAASGFEAPLDGTSEDVFEHFYVMLQASTAGLGVAIAPFILVADDIEKGALVAPLGFVRGTRSLEIWTREDIRRKSDVRALTEWLKAELRKAVLEMSAGMVAEDEGV